MKLLTGYFICKNQSFLLNYAEFFIITLMKSVCSFPRPRVPGTSLSPAQRLRITTFQPSLKMNGHVSRHINFSLLQVHAGDGSVPTISPLEAALSFILRPKDVSQID